MGLLLRINLIRESYNTMGVEIYIPSGSPFTIRNIPFGVISTKDNPTPRCATAIGGYAIDLGVYSSKGHLSKLSLDTSITEIFNEVGLIPSASPKIECIVLTTLKAHVERFCRINPQHSARRAQYYHSGCFGLPNRRGMFNSIRSGHNASTYAYWRIFGFLLFIRALSKCEKFLFFYRNDI